jgi:hypothetical protein
MYTCHQHRHHRSFCRPEDWYHPNREGAGLQTKSAPMDSKSTSSEPALIFPTYLLRLRSSWAVQKMPLSEKFPSWTLLHKTSLSPPTISHCHNLRHVTSKFATHRSLPAEQPSHKQQKSRPGWVYGDRRQIVSKNG